MTPLLQLAPVPEAGLPTVDLGEHVDLLLQVVEQLGKLYEDVGYQPPWVGYLATCNGRCVGTCGFKGPPEHRDGAARVEIAYFTLPGNEGQGYATAMARELVRLAEEAGPTVVVAAQTLREEGPSTTILKKLGFTLVAELLHPDDGEVWEWRLPSPQPPEVK